MKRRKPGPKPKSHCIHGHDISIVGRDNWGVCNGCVKPVTLGLRKSKRVKKQFCKRGHDKLVTGTTTQGACKICQQDYEKKRHKRRYKPVPNPFKHLCPKGHNKDIVGRMPHGNCVPCAKIAAKEWKKTEKGKLTAKLWYINNLVGNSPENQKRRKRYSDIIKMRHWKERGVKKLDGTAFTVIDYDILFKKQKGKCAICGRHQSILNTALAVDHDHQTGLVRGLLCLSCNVLLGKYEKNNGPLKKYLNSHEREKHRASK